MADAFVAEIRMFGCNFAPRNWAYCNGQILAIQQNTALFSLLGTTYGGNGTTTFALPNLQGMAANNQGQGPGLSSYQLGQTSGTSTVTLVSNQIPPHTHTAIGDNGDGVNGNGPAGHAWATPSADRDANLYNPNGALVNMSAAALANTGGGQPHNNMMPYQVVGFCIALQGIFPARN